MGSNQRSIALEAVMLITDVVRYIFDIKRMVLLLVYRKWVNMFNILYRISTVLDTNVTYV
jgi:hypothetical protein